MGGQRQVDRVGHSGKSNSSQSGRECGSTLRRRDSNEMPRAALFSLVLALHPAPWKGMLKATHFKRSPAY